MEHRAYHMFVAKLSAVLLNMSKFGYPDSGMMVQNFLD